MRSVPCQDVESYQANALAIKTYVEEDKDGEKWRWLELLIKISDAHLVVAAFIATITFIVGLAVAGGYDGNDSPNQGMAVLSRKAAFETFIVTDTIAVMSSILAVLHILSATFYRYKDILDKDKLYSYHITALVLVIIAIIAMVIAFVTGLYSVLDNSLGLTISVCVTCGFAIPAFCSRIHVDIELTKDMFKTIIGRA